MDRKIQANIRPKNIVLDKIIGKMAYTGALASRNIIDKLRNIDRFRNLVQV